MVSVRFLDIPTPAPNPPDQSLPAPSHPQNHPLLPHLKPHRPIRHLMRDPQPPTVVRDTTENLPILPRPRRSPQEKLPHPA